MVKEKYDCQTKNKILMQHNSRRQKILYAHKRKSNTIFN